MYRKFTNSSSQGKDLLMIKRIIKTICYQVQWNMMIMSDFMTINQIIIFLENLGNLQIKWYKITYISWILGAGWKK